MTSREHDNQSHSECGHHERRPSEPSADDVPEGTIWTCPMHPQIRRNGPGSCPICGMALEPLEPTAEEEANPELIDMTRRFWVSLVLTVPIVFLVVATELFAREPLPMRESMWVQLLLSTPVVLWGGWPFFERLWTSLRTRNLNMFTLIGLGVGVAYGYSVVGTILSGELVGLMHGAPHRRTRTIADEFADPTPFEDLLRGA